MLSRLVLIGLAASFSGSAFAQEVELPRDPRAWFNSSPVSLQTLRGKGVVLYFFEEG